MPPASAPATAGYGPPDPSGWLPEIGVASGLNVLAGIWLIIAPFVVGYDKGDPYWNDIVFGAIVAVLALARLAGADRGPIARRRRGSGRRRVRDQRRGYVAQRCSVKSWSRIPTLPAI
jgi:hypothetical protein